MLGSNLKQSTPMRSILGSFCQARATSLGATLGRGAGLNIRAACEGLGPSLEKDEQRAQKQNPPLPPLAKTTILSCSPPPLGEKEIGRVAAKKPFEGAEQVHAGVRSGNLMRHFSDPEGTNFGSEMIFRGCHGIPAWEGI